MCGIVGVAGSACAAVDRDLLLRQVELLGHRGPDASDTWISGANRVAFGHSRLAIIDLSPAGNQPMADAAGELRIVFNGEVYNFRELRQRLQQRGHHFRTGTDTEIVLEAYRAWGTDCLEQLRGMFAFALHDGRNHTVFCARDRAGEKPFYYSHRPGEFAFASELKALLADPRCPRLLDARAVDAYFAYGFVPGELCILKGVHKLPPAHALLYDLRTDTLKTWRYWSLPTEPAHATDADALLEELLPLLEDAVRGQLAADVPVGILLSGGIDSSIVAALACRVSGPQVRTFTVSFPGHGAFDEGPYARAVARHLQTDHHELQGEPGSVDLLPRLARQFDEPLADSSMIPTYLVARAIREHAGVALGGDGGDELFGGYGHYRWLLQQKRALRYVPMAARQLASVAGRALPIGARGRNHLIALGGDLATRVAHVNLYFDERSRARLLAPLGRRPTSFRAEQVKEQVCASGDPVHAASTVDFLTYLADDLLVKVDRAAMLTSLEVRAPLLDHRVVEFAFARVPGHLKVNPTGTKVLLRRLAGRLLPREIAEKPKQGFSLPLGSWFAGPFGAFIAEVIDGASPNLFDRSFIRSVQTGQHHGRNNTQRLFALAMFELWRTTYDITDAA